MTLAGRHVMTVWCPACGHHTVIDDPEIIARRLQLKFPTVTCSECGHRFAVRPQDQTISWSVAEEPPEGREKP